VVAPPTAAAAQLPSIAFSQSASTAAKDAEAELNALKPPPGMPGFDGQNPDTTVDNGLVDEATQVGSPEKPKPMTDEEKIAAIKKAQEEAATSEAIEKLTLTKRYYNEALRFIDVLHDATGTICQLLGSRNKSEVIEAMDRICVEAEQTQPLNLEQDFLNRVFTRVDQSIAMAALFTAYHLKVKCIAALTESGSTALWMSRLNCGVPIYALTSQTATRYRCALFRDVYPLMVKYVGHDREELLREAEKTLFDNKVVKEGDLIVLTIGEPIGKAGGTNTMKIVKVGEHLKP
jgi:hypothetical protein